MAAVAMKDVCQETKYMILLIKRHIDWWRIGGRSWCHKMLKSKRLQISWIPARSVPETYSHTFLEPTSIQASHLSSPILIQTKMFVRLYSQHHLALNNPDSDWLKRAEGKGVTGEPTKGFISKYTRHHISLWPQRRRSEDRMMSHCLCVWCHLRFPVCVSVAVLAAVLTATIFNRVFWSKPAALNKPNPHLWAARPAWTWVEERDTHRVQQGALPALTEQRLQPRNLLFRTSLPRWDKHGKYNWHTDWRHKPKMMENLSDS